MVQSPKYYLLPTCVIISTFSTMHLLRIHSIPRQSDYSAALCIVEKEIKMSLIAPFLIHVPGVISICFVQCRWQLGFASYSWAVFFLHRCLDISQAMQTAEDACAQLEDELLCKFIIIFFVIFVAVACL